MVDHISSDDFARTFDQRAGQREPPRVSLILTTLKPAVY